MMGLSRCRWMSFALLLAWGPVFAHHGTAGTYDQQKVIQITGVVKEFVFRNPHAALVLVGKDEGGKEVTYSLEISPPSSLVRAGYNKSSFKPGDTMTVSIHPSFNNPNVGEPVGGRIVLNGKPMAGVGGGQEP